MTLGDHQELLAQYLPLLLLYMRSRGYRPRLSFCKRCFSCPVGKRNSNHKQKCAIDIDLFDCDNNYLEETEDHRQFGEYWESLHPKLRWGGRFNDGNHYAVLCGGVI